MPLHAVQGPNPNPCTELLPLPFLNKQLRSSECSLVMGKLLLQA